MVGRTSRPKQRVSWPEGLVALVAVGSIALLIVPLPTWLLDLLITGNLLFSLVVLLVALQTSSALRVATFPVLILVSTLVRLSLNVSSTRLILLQADAGRVIDAFGHLVIGSNAAVGGVVFVLLAVVQLVVVAKGAERVAEVGARFSLDALPAKQLAIEALLKRGAISPTEAERRRADLERDSRFYGAMDGAMKFVKGDAVASLVIVSVNLVGGFAVGMGQQGLDALGALERYGTLTIGDGLAAQIPALVTATAAGILVTRVEHVESSESLARQLLAQLFDHSGALAIAGLCSGILGLVPGLPAVPFFVVGAALLILALLSRDRGALEEHLPPVWALQVAESERFLLQPRGVPGVRSLLGKGPLHRIERVLRRTASEKTGLHIPQGVVGVSPTASPGHVTLVVRGVAVDGAPVQGDALQDLSNRLNAVWLQHLHDLVTLGRVEERLDDLARQTPGLVRAAVPSRLPLPRLTRALRRLAHEGVQVDWERILEVLAEAPALPEEPEQLAETLRPALRATITESLGRGRDVIPVIALDELLEDTVREAIFEREGRRTLALGPGAAHDIVAATARCLEAAPASGPQSAALGGVPVALLVATDIRRFVRDLVAHEFPALPVITHTDLTAEARVRQVATVTIVGAAPFSDDSTDFASAF